MEGRGTAPYYGGGGEVNHAIQGSAGAPSILLQRDAAYHGGELGRK